MIVPLKTNVVKVVSKIEKIQNVLRNTKRNKNKKIDKNQEKNEPLSIPFEDSEDPTMTNFDVLFDDFYSRHPYVSYERLV